MSDHEDELQNDIGEVGKAIERIRGRLRPGGPEVDFALLYAYIDGGLPEAAEGELKHNLATWQTWHDEYWVIREALERADAKIPESKKPDPQAGIVAPPLEVKPSQRRIIILFAFPVKSAIRDGGMNQSIWSLKTNATDADIPLPLDIAKECYGRSEQTVRLNIHQAAMSGVLGKSDVRIEVWPGPSKATFAIHAIFANDACTFKIPIPQMAGRNVFSELVNPVTEIDWSADQWKVQISFASGSSLE